MANKLRAYAELLRLSNVLTAVADVWMGMVVATGGLNPPITCVLLTATSVMLYLSGMVLNDVYDAKVDSEERPDRPIPSGRIRRQDALRLGYGLMLGGLLCAAGASIFGNSGYPISIACCLAWWIWLYDAKVKETKIGPTIMGMCRATNVLLGLFALGNPVSEISGIREIQESCYIAAGMFLYIVGMTMFARNEANTSRRKPLAIASLISLGGLAIFALGPNLTGITRELTVPQFRWYLLWLVMAMLVGRRYVAAILQPTPRHVQQAVGNAIRSIIVIDAALAWGYAEPFWGLAILALLPPTVLLARFIPQT